MYSRSRQSAPFAAAATCRRMITGKAAPPRSNYGARHRRSRTDWPKVGIFARRGRNRPNRIGVSVCRIAQVSGLTLRVQDLDAIDGTPVLDIKPVMTGFRPRGDVKKPDWAREIVERYRESAFEKDRSSTNVLSRRTRTLGRLPRHSLGRVPNQLIRKEFATRRSHLFSKGETS
jgi:hypothetical protein